MAMARMAAEARPHRHFHRQAAEQRRDRSAARSAAGLRNRLRRIARTASPPLRHRCRATAGSSARRRRPSRSAAVEMGVASSAPRSAVRPVRKPVPAAPGWRRSRATTAASRASGSAISRLRGLARALSIALAMPASPGSGRGPRRHSGPARARGRGNGAGSSPTLAKGCLSSASSGTGAKRASAASASRQRKAPALVWARGRPAESSIAMSQRVSSAATRRARLRSGVTSAAVRPSCFQRLAQRQRDRQRFLGRIVGDRSAQCLSSPPRSRRRRVSARARQASVVGAGRRVSRSSVSRAGLASAACQSSTSSRSHLIVPAIASSRIADGRDRDRPSFSRPARDPAPAAPPRPSAGARSRASSSRGGGNRAGGTRRDHHAWRRLRFQPLPPAAPAPAFAASAGLSAFSASRMRGPCVADHVQETR